MKKKILLSLFAIVLLLGATTGCGKKEEKKNEDVIININYWNCRMHKN